MTKINIKKNEKPQKKTKQKQKQTQKQNVTVNIGTNVIKKRGRPKKAQPTKQTPTKQAQPIIAPSFSSFNQPIFKPPIPQQQSSLASTILATQEKPKVVAEEKKEQTTLQKALQEQNSNDPIETKENDLERVRNKRVEKLEKQEREALTSQVLSNQQDDTEEIAQLIPQPKIKNIPYNTIDISSQTDFLSTPLSRLPPITPTNTLFSLSSSEPTSGLYGLRRYQQKKKLEANLILKQFQDLEGQLKAEEPFEEEAFATPTEAVNPEVAAQQEEVLSKIKGRGPVELITETPSESTPLSQPTVELGFGGLSESVQTSVGQFLPPAPVSQNELTVKESKKKAKSILKPIEPPPSITEEQETTPSILQDVRAADQYVTQQLVKDEPPGGAPLAESRVIDPTEKIPTPLKQVIAKWNELKDQGLITSEITSEPVKSSSGSIYRPKRVLEDLLSEIQYIEGYDNWKPTATSTKPGPKGNSKVVVAQAIIGGTEL